MPKGMGLLFEISSQAQGYLAFWLGPSGPCIKAGGTWPVRLHLEGH